MVHWLQQFYITCKVLSNKNAGLSHVSWLEWWEHDQWLTPTTTLSCLSIIMLFLTQQCSCHSDPPSLITWQDLLSTDHWAMVKNIWIRRECQVLLNMINTPDLLQIFMQRHLTKYFCSRIFLFSSSWQSTWDVVMRCEKCWTQYLNWCIQYSAFAYITSLLSSSSCADHKQNKHKAGCYYHWSKVRKLSDCTCLNNINQALVMLIPRCQNILRWN